MKFYSLLRKEIKELMTVQTIISLFLTLGIFYVIGNVMTGVTDDLDKKASTITICDQDNSEFTKNVIKALKDPKSKIEVKEVKFNSTDYQKEINDLGIDSVIVIPKGFANDVIVKNKKAELINISSMKTISISGTVSSASSSAGLEAIKEAVKTTLMSEKNINLNDIKFIQDPVKQTDITVVGDKSAKVNTSKLSGFVSTQGIFVPIVIFLLVMYASQMIISAIATEKVDKTLETLLSAPVSRVSVLSAKMLAAAMVAALNAIVYMIGFSSFMNGMTGGATKESGNVSKYVSELGLKLQGMDYVFLGMQMFLTILIALSVSLILGALAKDVKSAQTLIMPVMFAAMIPYMITLFIDVNSLSIVPKLLIYAIPFTHTFIAVDNILFAKDTLFWGGFAYQIVFLAVCMFFAVRVFMTDKLFTIRLSLGQKKGFSGKKGISLFKKN